MTTDVILYVHSCLVCNKNKKPKTKPRAGLGSYRTGAQMERVHMDMLGPFSESEDGNKYILLMVDQFPKWVEIHAVPDQTADHTAKIAVDQFFSWFGSPLQIHTDQGKNFNENVMKALCDLYCISKTRTTPYQPCLNGQVERYNHLLLQLIHCYQRAQEKTWDRDLQLLAWAIRGMTNCSTGFSANMLMLGMEVLQPVDVLFGSALMDTNSGDVVGYVKHLWNTLREVHALATHKLRAQMQYQKHVYDLHLEEKHYDVGDLVFQLNSATKTRDSKKLNPVWVGPLLVTEVLSPVLYRVQDCKKEYVLHHDWLKCCEDHTIPMWLHKMCHNLMALDTTIGYDETEQEADTNPPNDLQVPGPVASVHSEFPTPEGPEGTSEDSPSPTNEVQISSQKVSAPLEEPITQSIEEQSTFHPSTDEDRVCPDPTVQIQNGYDLWETTDEDLGLATLFSESPPTVHIYAKKKDPSREVRPQRPKRVYTPMESVSRTGTVQTSVSSPGVLILRTVKGEGGNENL